MGRLMRRCEPFVYPEHCVLSLKDGVAVVTTGNEATPLPLETISSVMIGPGCRITSSWVAEAASCHVALVFTGEEGVRFYAAGRPFGRDSRVALAHVERWVSDKELARSTLFSKRWGQPPMSCTAHAIFGEEGARCRVMYRALVEAHGLIWGGRRRASFDGSDAVNEALSWAGMAASSVAAAAVHAVGALPALGFIHSGTTWAFVYDVADLVRNDMVEAAIQQVSSGRSTASDIRRACRDRIRTGGLLDELVVDILEVVGCS